MWGVLLMLDGVAQVLYRPWSVAVAAGVSCIYGGSMLLFGATTLLPRHMRLVLTPLSLSQPTGSWTCFPAANPAFGAYKAAFGWQAQHFHFLGTVGVRLVAA